LAFDEENSGSGTRNSGRFDFVEQYEGSALNNGNDFITDFEEVKGFDHPMTGTPSKSRSEGINFDSSDL
jgi:hypothetical protein